MLTLDQLQAKERGGRSSAVMWPGTTLVVRPFNGTSDVVRFFVRKVRPPTGIVTST